MNRNNSLAVEVQLQHAGAAYRLARHLALGLGSALDQDPRRLQWVGVADAERNFARMLACEPLRHIEHATAQLLDGLVAGKRPAPDLVHKPAGANDRNLPVGCALEIPPELRLDQRRLGDERHRLRQLGVYQFGGFTAALQRAALDGAD